MKLTQSHYKEISILFAKHDFATEDITLIKRRGRINIIHEESGEVFSYFKKKAASIDFSTQRLEQQVHFLVSISGSKETPVNSWEDVIAALDSWLADLKK